MNYFEKTNTEWLKERWGCFTGSEIDRLLGSGFDKYVDEVACQAYTEFEENTFEGNWAMREGKKNEPLAFQFHQKIIQANFGDLVRAEYYGDATPLFKKYNDHSGASADSIIYKADSTPYIAGEYKCPTRDVHFWRLRNLKDHIDLKKAHPNYYGQLQFNMMCWNVDLSHWCSFNDKFIALSDKMVLIEVPADKNYQMNLKAKLSMAIKRKLVIISEMQNRKE